ncbi:MAG: outer membrane beta-barrel protein [Chthoniobacterales bacterium]
MKASIHQRRRGRSLVVGALVFVFVSVAAQAQDAVAPSARCKIYGWVEGGVTANPDEPATRQNFGHLFSDRSNELLLNQTVITAERTLGGGDNFDWGFKAQFLYGSDARFIHSVGLLDNTQHELWQPDLVEAWVLLRFPITNTAGGLDVKGGKFVTLEGAETIDPRPNVFYSHSYIFNFGLPLNHTGILFILHALKWFDFYAGATRGVNTSVTDNNSSLGFLGGFGLNFFEGKLTALATTHVGPESYHDNHDERYLNDLVITWKATSKLTAILEGNFAMDESVPGNAKAYGGAIYLTCALNHWLSLGIREEIFCDETGFFVGSFADNDDFIDLQRGETTHIDPRTFFAAGTFNEVTIGASIKIPLAKPLASLTIRPELRYDAALSSGTTPFGNQDVRDQFTASIDAIVSF